MLSGVQSYSYPIISALRADSICNNPIPEWQSRIGTHGSFCECSDAVCATVFGIDFLQGFLLEQEHDHTHGVRL